MCLNSDRENKFNLFFPLVDSRRIVLTHAARQYQQQKLVHYILHVLMKLKKAKAHNDGNLTRKDKCQYY